MEPVPPDVELEYLLCYDVNAELEHPRSIGGNVHYVGKLVPCSRAPSALGRRAFVCDLECMKNVVEVERRPVDSAVVCRLGESVDVCRVSVQGRYEGSCVLADD